MTANRALIVRDRRVHAAADDAPVAYRPLPPTMANPGHPRSALTPTTHDATTYVR